jgi:hypothetical protein
MAALPIKRLSYALLIAFVLLCYCVTSCSDMLGRYAGGSSEPDEIIETRGREFFVSFQENTDEMGPVGLSLYISAETHTTGQISIAGISYIQEFTLAAHSVIQIQIPVEAMVTSNNVVENLGIGITSEQPVAVYGVNHSPHSTDTFLAYPVQTCGLEYYCMSYETNLPAYPGSYFTIAAIQDDTAVTITPSVTSGGHPAGVSYSIMMDRGQTYRLYDEAGDVKDITGSHILSDKPIAVFSGHLLCNIPTSYPYGDHVVEQLLPVSKWGTTYRTVPFLDRGGDTMRILAAYDGTTVSINGTAVAVLNAGEHTDEIITESSVIRGSNPVLVTHFAHGSTYDNNDNFGDPFMLLVPACAQYRTAYTFCTVHDDFGDNYINIIVPSEAISQMRLDGSLLNSSLFSEIDEHYSGAQVPVLLGTHTINGPRRFGLLIYGFGYNDSYGHAGG